MYKTFRHNDEKSEADVQHKEKISELVEMIENLEVGVTLEITKE